MFFAAVPSKDVRADRLTVGDVDVTITSSRGRPAVERARSIARRTITRLTRDFGPFPMPRMEILLTDWESGMEYYGATRTGLWSLEHELGHMHFGVTVVNRTWRDTWLDESAVVWWERHRALEPVKRRFRSAIGGGRPAAAPGFDEAAYGAGARVLEAIATALGGDRVMLAFLARLHARRKFDPFTTDEFIDDVLARKSPLDRGRLERCFCRAAERAPGSISGVAKSPAGPLPVVRQPRGAGSMHRRRAGPPRRPGVRRRSR